MGSNVVEVGSANFQSEVLDSDIPTIVDFWAEWCGPCKALAPTLDSLAGEYGGKVKVAKLNVDDNQDVAVQYNIQAIPTLLAFKGGEVIQQVRGPRSRDLKKFFDSLT